eukprot:scaffold31132_cov34-Attheya_sp.AAC.3
MAYSGSTLTINVMYRGKMTNSWSTKANDDFLYLYPIEPQWTELYLKPNNLPLLVGETDQSLGSLFHPPYL